MARQPQISLALGVLTLAVLAVTQFVAYDQIGWNPGLILATLLVLGLLLTNRGRSV
jgi:hypothetical protein